MGVIIKKIDGGYEICTVSHNPINFTPYTNPSAISDFVMCMRNGFMEDLCGLEIDKEYDLETYKHFEEYKRNKQIVHENGLVYDDVFYKLKNDVLISHQQ